MGVCGALARHVGAHTGLGHSDGFHGAPAAAFGGTESPPYGAVKMKAVEPEPMTFDE